MNRWLKLLAALSLSVALIGAPCRNCEPKPAKEEAQKCQHDCCPKPKPEKAGCKWQPADYAAVEAKQEFQAAPQMECLTSAPAILVSDRTLEAVAAPQAESDPPPLYLTHHQFRN